MKKETAWDIYYDVHDDEYNRNKWKPEKEWKKVEVSYRKDQPNNETPIYIGKSAFEGQSKIEEFNFGYHVSSIGESAFKDCKNLRVVKGGVEKIGRYAFSGCISLDDISSLMYSVRIIGDYAFYNCKKLKEVSYIKGDVGEGAFYGCDSLKKLSFSYEGSATIGKNAFSYCDSLEDFSWLDCALDIKEGAFSNCKKLGKNGLRLPDSIRIIRKSTFENCKGLKSLSIPENVKEIDEGAFLNCSALERISFKYGLERIGDNAFSGCDLEKLELPKSLTRIGSGAFSVQKKKGRIRELTIPSSVNTIGKNAFLGQPIGKLHFDRGIQYIEEGAFIDCTLYEVSIPSSIKEIKDGAFPKGTLILIDGTPYEDIEEENEYRKSKEEFENRIAHNNNEIVRLNNDIGYMKKFISDYEREIEENNRKIEELKSIDYDKEINALIEKRTKEIESIENEINEQENLISKKNEEILKLKNEIDGLFFLAKNKRKELTEVLTKEEAILFDMENKKKECERKKHDKFFEYQNEIDKLFNKKDSLGKLLKDNETSKYWIQNKNDNIVIYTGKIEDLKKELVELNVQLSDHIKKHDEKEAKDKVSVKERKLVAERDSLIHKIGKPNLWSTKVEAGKGKIKIGEAFLNEFEKYLGETVAKDNSNLIDGFINKNEISIKRIKDINNEISKDQYSGIQFLKKSEVMDLDKMSHFIQIHSILSDGIEDKSSWKEMCELGSRAIMFSKSDEYNTKMFSNLNGFTALGSNGKKNNDSLIVFLPYLVVIYSQTSKVSLYRYGDISISLSHFEKKYEKKNEKWEPPYGSIVLKKQYLHENMDGTPNRRYIDNPLSVTIQNVQLMIELGDEKYGIYMTSLRDGERLEWLIDRHKIECGDSIDRDNFFQRVFNGDASNLKTIMEEKYQKEEKAKKDELERIEKEKEEEKKRILDAEKEKREKRENLIKKQKEINEAKKSEKKIVKPTHETMSVFYDEEEDDEVTKDKKEEIKSTSFEIKSKAVITNNVFKVTIVFGEKYDSEKAELKFVDKNGSSISNKRTIKEVNSGEEMIIGFVLDSGIDFTVMKECFLKVESSNLKEDYPFEMNISFYSDF